MTEISVILCALDEEERIGRQLRALDAQVGAPPFEVVVVDNGSRDRTVEVVRTWIASQGRVAATAVLVDAEATPGIPAARNAGVLAASGEIFAFCDADDEVDPGWVAAMAAAVDGDVLVGGRLLVPTAESEGERDLYGSGPVRTSYLPHVGGANFGVSRTVYMDVGGFDESLPRYGFDDVDFSWRVQEAGYPLRYAPEAIVRFTLSGGTASVRKRFLLGQGRVLMARRFPRYDSTDYTLRRTLVDAVRAFRALAGALLTRRSAARARASVAVAAAGRVVGAVRYRPGSPALRRRLLEERDR